MPFTKNIHFRSKDVTLKLEVTSEWRKPDKSDLKKMLRCSIDGELYSLQEYPKIQVDKKTASDFWDLVRENIVETGAPYVKSYIQCQIRQEIQKQL